MMVIVVVTVVVTVGLLLLLLVVDMMLVHVSSERGGEVVGYIIAHPHRPPLTLLLKSCRG